MRRLAHISALLSVVIAFGALAQTPADQLKGTWIGDTPACGSAKLNVASVDASGVVRGSFECTKRNSVLSLGDKAEFNKSMAAKLRGQNLDIEGANGTGFQLVLQGKQLTGSGLNGPGVKNPVAFSKQ